jgi:hypothetical protein
MRLQFESLRTIFALAAVLFLTGCQSTAGPKKGPPQNTRLGGDIYIHGNGAQSDWT